MQTSTLDAPVRVPPRPRTGAVFGAPRVLLQLEGAAMFALAIAAFAYLDHSWTLFATLFLVPDLGMLGYLGGPRAGAAAYNATHALLGPAVIGAIALATDAPVLGAVALIWCAHIGFDRLLGYGLKYGSAFRHTHLS